MSIPINIKDLIERRVVESTRIEYKAGWNPESVMKTICAFANDIENVGGGYIILGMQCHNGMPSVINNGIEADQVDQINLDLFNKCNLIDPRYVPVTEAVKYQGETVIIIWAYAGDNRPYRCPSTFREKDGAKTKVPKVCWIRRLGSTIKANRQDELELMSFSGIIPFDDRLNRQAVLDDLSPTLILSFLHRVGSNLNANATEMTLAELAQSLQIAGGAAETIKPRNVGLLFFNNAPEQFFRYAQIEVVDKPDPTGEGMVEKVFRGPLDRQLDDALTFIKNYVIKEKIRKLPDEQVAKRVFNYPLRAIEEALANAVYHKAYDTPEPITVTIAPEKIEITSIPGPDRSISDEAIKGLKMVSKQYRNRRIGNFLKELKMIEGRNTGIPTILQSLKNNGSPLPIFETDESRSYLTVIFPIHHDFIEDEIPHKNTSLINSLKSKRSKDDIKELILMVLDEGEISTQNLVKILGYTDRTKSFKIALLELIESGEVTYTIPGQPKNRNQKLRKR